MKSLLNHYKQVINVQLTNLHTISGDRIYLNIENNRKYQRILPKETKILGAVLLFLKFTLIKTDFILN